MPKIIKSLALDFYDEIKITEYCKQNKISFSKFVGKLAVDKINSQEVKIE